MDKRVVDRHRDLVLHRLLIRDQPREDLGDRLLSSSSRYLIGMGSRRNRRRKCNNLSSNLKVKDRGSRYKGINLYVIVIPIT